MKDITIKEFLQVLPHPKEVPVVSRDSSLKEVAKVMIRGRRRRIVYIVDSKHRPIGAITLNDLKDVVFNFCLTSKLGDALVVSEHISDLVASGTADEVMEPDLIICSEMDDLMSVLCKMVERDVMDVPVVDQEGRLVADLDILDLLEWWMRKGSEGF